MAYEKQTKNTIKLHIQCGEKTCAYESGKFCHYFGTIHFGQIAVCRLFPTEHNTFTDLKEENGWTLRCDECLKASK
jgi:hypothetical protein